MTLPGRCNAMAEEETPVLDEQERVFRWRLLRFLYLGVELEDAEYLAATRADPHALDALLRKGCPLETALRIIA